MKTVGSWQWAVEEKIVGSGQWARMRSAELKKVYQKTLWAGLKRILLLRFLCFRKIFGTGFIMNMCNFLMAGGSSLWGGYFVIVGGWCIFIEKIDYEGESRSNVLYCWISR